MYKLFIDESGKNTLTQIQDFNPHFSIGGTLVHEDSSKFIRIKGDQIRFKYWGHTDTTFRGNNIRRLDGDFSIFKDEINVSDHTLKKDNSEIRNNFYSDFTKYITTSNFRYIWVCVNKNEWIKNNPPIKHALDQRWDKTVTNFEKKLTKLLFEEVVKIYICYLAKKGNVGQIVVEASDINQDGDFLETYNQFMFNGIPSMGLSSLQVRERLTCISFATKNNRDGETQLADIGSHFLNLQARIDDNSPYNKPISDFEKKIIEEFNKKAFLDSCNAQKISSIRKLT